MVFNILEFFLENGDVGKKERGAVHHNRYFLY